MAFIYGKNLLRESILNNKSLKCIYINSKYHELYNLAKSKNINIKVVDDEYLKNIIKDNAIQSSKIQGIVGIIEDYKYSSLEDIVSNAYKEYPLIVMLDSLEDPHNLGAILRTCDAAKVDGVIIGKNRSVRLNDTVARVSTGAIEYVKVCEVTNLTETIKKLKKLGYWIVGAEYTESSVDFRSIKYDMPTCLVIGSEGKGISSLVTKNCDFLVKIPMFGHVNSLNASVSGSILIYEILKYHNK